VEVRGPDLDHVAEEVVDVSLPFISELQGWKFRRRRRDLLRDVLRLL
jgi:hypothetical protein